MKQNFGCVALMLFLLGTAFVSNSWGQCKGCEKWCKQKGYCTDYIESKTGKRQSGDAGKWKGNIAKGDVKPGDAAIFNSPGVGHVGYVERVIYERNTSRPFQVELSEWNYGPRWVDQSCSVTDFFGRTLSRNRIVLVSSVDRFWRP